MGSRATWAAKAPYSGDGELQNTALHLSKYTDFYLFDSEMLTSVPLNEQPFIF